MNEEKKIVILAVVAAIVVPISVSAYFLYGLIEPEIQMADELEQAQIRLLCETDHRALLEACRELSERYLSGELDPNHPLKSSQLSEVISALQPDSVTIAEDGVVHIWMGNKWWPLGVHAYPKGYPKYPPPFKYGDRMLLDGLWYFEDGYSAHPDEYDKRIDELLSRRQEK